MKSYSEDRHSAWGSDIDETFCGSDEWTPMNSLAATPESQRRRLSDLRIDDVITEQPRIFENSDDNLTNYDVMTVHEFQDFEVPTVVVPRKKKLRRKRKLKRKTRKMKRSEEGVEETPILRSFSSLISQ
uniref:Uncharacterized protein n=1 Tax=Caenorhabditis tropicalis TaxID=1561998 RepID=A0A1I7UWE8_9PELO